MKSSDIIIGRQPLIEAMEAGRPIDKILFQRNVSGESIGDIRKLAEKRGIPIQQVPVEKLLSLTRANHQGVIALAAHFQYMARPPCSYYWMVLPMSEISGLLQEVLSVVVPRP